MILIRNEGKIKTALQEFPSISAIKPSFNEEEIQRNLGNPDIYGMLYPLYVSKEKLLAEMNYPYPKPNDVLVVSDSVIGIKEVMDG